MILRQSKVIYKRHNIPVIFGRKILAIFLAFSLLTGNTCCDALQIPLASQNPGAPRRPEPYRRIQQGCNAGPSFGVSFPHFPV